MGKKYGLEINTKQNFIFIIQIGIYLFLGIYMLSTTYSTAFVGLEVEEINSKWVIKKIHFDDWAKDSNISIGDAVISINSKPTEHFINHQSSPSIRGGARTIHIEKIDGSELKIDVNHFNLSQQFYIHFLFPCIYFCLNLAVSFYLFIYKKHTLNINALISFILCVSLAYVSTGAAARFDIAGLIFSAFFMISSLITFLIFLKNYFTLLKIKYYFIKNHNYLYILLSFALFIMCTRFLYTQLVIIEPIFTLILFLILLFYISWIIVRGYIQSKSAKLKILFIGLISPFLPFVILYALPSLLFKEGIITADISALFLLLIPFNIIFLQLTERLFDLTYHITRLRYYTGLSLMFTCCVSLGAYLILDITKSTLFGFVFFVFVATMVFLYLKERADFSEQKVLFASQEDHIHILHQTIQRLSGNHRIEDMLKLLAEEVGRSLEIKEVYVVTFNIENNQISSTNSAFTFADFSSFENLEMGQIEKFEHSYIAPFYEDKNYKHWLVINHRQTIRLKREELLRLELLLAYINVFIDSTKAIEELVDELQHLQQQGIHEPIWLKKYVWLRVEKEKFQLAQELHDNFLQDQIHIVRQMDLLTHESPLPVVQTKIGQLREQTLRSITQLRAYCETLKPPLLNSMGLYAALEQLTNKITKQADFTINACFESLSFQDKQLTLTVYRIMQELLNNALKHSEASEVDISLQKHENGFEILYYDNGIGCSNESILHSSSFGLHGIRERIDAYGGKVIIHSEPHKGMYVQITVDKCYVIEQQYTHC